ncbi:MAG: hypothetical protein V3R94_12955, partial [Acidobacteriota bacterium]
ADDVLRFGRGNEVRVRELITYDNFQKFEVNTSIRYEPIEGQDPDPDPELESGETVSPDEAPEVP